MRRRLGVDCSARGGCRFSGGVWRGGGGGSGGATALGKFVRYVDVFGKYRALYDIEGEKSNDLPWLTMRLEKKSAASWDVIGGNKFSSMSVCRV